MAKRAAPDERPYRPLLDAELVSAAISQVVPGAASASDSIASQPAKIVVMPRVEPPRRLDVAQNNGRSSMADAEAAGPAVQAVIEKFDHEKRILFTRPESQAIDRLVVSLATRLNSQVKVSHVMRALVALLLNAESEVDRRAGETGPLIRPANG